MAATISGFTVIPVCYDSSTTHYLYARAHSNGARTRKALPDGRTLFLVNVPPDATERELRLFFQHAGTVERVAFGHELVEVDEEEEEASDDDDEDENEDEDDDEDDEDEEEGADKPRKSHKRKTRTHQETIPKVTPLPPTPSRRFRKTGLTAHVVFLDASSLQRALASTSKPRAWPSPSSDEPSGLAHYKAVYAALRPALDSVKAFADSAMELHEYNERKEKRQSRYKKGEAIVDEDGFTLVTRGGAYGKTLGGGVGVASKRFQRSAREARSRGTRKKKEGKEKEGFYSFQRAEKQRAGLWSFLCFFFSLFFLLNDFWIDLLELKRKWEEDKARVEKLKASRRFRPY